MPDQWTLYNSWNGDIAFQLSPLRQFVNTPQHLPTYTVVWICDGSGFCTSDHFCLPIDREVMLFFGPFQPFVMDISGHAGDRSGWVFRFSNEFFCLERHRKEVGCNGLLFNNPYEVPFLQVDGEDHATFFSLTGQMIEAFSGQRDLEKSDILFSYLKIMLVHASRICVEQQHAGSRANMEKEAPATVQRFRELVDEHYTHCHSPSEYAARLHISLKALAKLTRKYFLKTPGEVIADKIIIEAKRALYLTESSVKEIGFELGFRDSHYFSRFFKKNVGVSAERFRKEVGTVRGIAEAVAK